MGIDVAYVVFGLLGLYVMYAIIVPPKAIRERIKADIAKNTKKDSRTYKRKVYDYIAIKSAVYERGPINGYITNLQPRGIAFDQIGKGDFSQTIFVNVNVNGLIQVSDHEVDAQRKHAPGDYGIASITMSDGRIQCQDILPNGVDPKNLIKLRLNIAVSSE